MCSPLTSRPPTPAWRSQCRPRPPPGWLSGFVLRALPLLPVHQPAVMCSLFEPVSSWLAAPACARLLLPCLGGLPLCVTPMLCITPMLCVTPMLCDTPEIQHCCVCCALQRTSLNHSGRLKLGRHIARPTDTVHTESCFDVSDTQFGTISSAPHRVFTGARSGTQLACLYLCCHT
jgi:hypothetical protein